MQEGEDLPPSLSSRWQLKGCECAPRTARISQKTSFSRRVQPQKLSNLAVPRYPLRARLKLLITGGLRWVRRVTSFASKSLDGLGLAMGVCDLILRYKVAWLISNNSTGFYQF
jgi:hypothetical protein